MDKESRIIESTINETNDKLIFDDLKLQQEYNNLAHNLENADSIENLITAIFKNCAPDEAKALNKILGTLHSEDWKKAIPNIVKNLDDATLNLENTKQGETASTKNISYINSLLSYACPITQKLPTSFVYNTSLETQIIFSGKLSPIKDISSDSEQQKLLKIKAGETKEGVSVYNQIGISLTAYEKEFNIKLKNLKPIDGPVYDALQSLYVNGSEKVSLGTIYKTEVFSESAYANKATQLDLLDSINRLRRTDVYFANYGDSQIYGCRYSAALFGLMDVRVNWNSIDNPEILAQRDDFITINGFPVDVYITLRSFPLWEIAKQKGQVKRIPIKQLKTKNKKTSSYIILQYALLKRISAIPKLNNTIVYDSFFEANRLLEDEQGNKYNEKYIKVKKSRLKQHTRKILDDFIKNGFIKSYEENKEARNIVSVTIKK